MIPCPACGTLHVPGSTQCMKCGAAIPQAPAPSFGGSPGAAESGNGGVPEPSAPSAPMQPQATSAPAQPAPYAAPGAGYPGASPFGPRGVVALDVGDLLRTSAEIVKERVLLLTGLSALGIAPGYLVMLGGVFAAMPAVTPGSPPDPSAITDKMPLMIAAYLVGIVLTMAGAAITMPASSHVALHAFARTSRPNLSDSIAAGLRHALPLVGLMLAFFVAYLVVAAAIGAVVFGVGQIDPDASFVVALAIVAGITIVGGYIGLTFMLFVPVTVAEGAGMLDALRRSAELMKGHRLIALLTYIAMFCIYFVVAMVLGCCLGVPVAMVGSLILGPFGALLMYVILLPLVFAWVAWLHAMTSIAYARRSGYGSGTDGAAVARVFG